MPSPAAAFLALFAMGAGWGLTQPLAKIAVSTGHPPLGLVFWQLALGGVLLTAVNLARGLRPRADGPALAVYAFIALCGTILPNSASYRAAVHLPSGILSMIMATVPMMALPIAIALGRDRLSALRLLGLALGLGGVALIALPEGALPDPAVAPWIAVALIAPFFYAIEGNVVARWGTAGLDPVVVLQGASILGALLLLPFALASDAVVPLWAAFGPPEAALIALSVVHALAYALYVWLVGRAGAVFAAQVGYVVTGCGVIWAMILLGERYPASVWVALAVILAGVALVQPRRGRAAA